LIGDLMIGETSRSKHDMLTHRVVGQMKLRLRMGCQSANYVCIVVARRDRIAQINAAPTGNEPPNVNRITRVRGAK
jgi:hypothetical protein